MRTLCKTTSTPAPETNGKLRASAKALAAEGFWDAAHVAIVAVSQPGHVPADVAVRDRVVPGLFTADIPAGALRATLDDPLVTSVELAAPLVL